MKKLKARVLGLVLLVLQGAAWSDADLRQYSSELLQLESAQVMQPDRVFNYADPQYGAAMRRLLDPVRTKAVLNAYYDSARKGVVEPDITKQIQPMVNRLDKAFMANPKEYESEYLDSMTFVAEVMRLSFSPEMITAGKSQAASANLKPEEAAAIQQLLETATKLGQSIRVIIANGVRERVAKGLFSEAGAQRALALAQEFSPVAAASVPAQQKSRPLMEGAQVYAQACAACHTSGAAGAPRLGDHKAWAARIRTGQSALLQSTLNGKGAMAPMRGMGFSDLEIERAIVILANSAGGKFVYPVAVSAR